MPKTKLENAFFTLITSGFMIFIMGVYNTAVHTGGLKYSTFVYAAYSFLPEWLIGFLLAFFIAGRAANSSDKFCYGFSSADIFSRSALPVYFQSYIQIINNLSRLSFIYTTQIRKYCFPAVYVIK